MKKSLIVVFSLTLLAFPLLVFAQVNPIDAICTILNYIKLILLAVGLSIAMIILIIGGINYITSSGDAEKAGKAKGMIVNAIIGVIIILLAAFIIGLVQGLISGAGISPTYILDNPCNNIP